MDTPLRPDREPPEYEPLDSDEQLDEIEEEIDDDLTGLDITPADSFPASNPQTL
jgi:hypothetical protein